MRTLHTAVSRPYDIVIGPGLLKEAGERSRRINRGVRVLLVSDSNVAPLYADTVAESYAAAGYRVTRFVFPAGEESKRLSTIAALYEQLAADGLTRADLIAALGGGVTGDMAGFAAATWLRGIDFVSLPTSLLAQVDSSVGGKTGVDIPQGKNLVGAFWPPRLVLADTDALSTLPADILSDGMAEVVKAACIKDASFFHWLSRQDALSDENLPETVSRAVDIKRRVVESDEREAGERRLLNFGHTLGHALEAQSHFRLSHGRAVAAGMMLVTRAAERKGLTAPGTAKDIAALLRRYGLPDGDGTPPEEYLPYAALDKKRAGDSLSLVLLHRIGDGYIHPIPADSLPAFVAEPYRK